MMMNCGKLPLLEAKLKDLNEGKCYCSGSKGEHRWSKSKKFEDD